MDSFDFFGKKPFRPEGILVKTGIIHFLTRGHLSDFCELGFQKPKKGKNVATGKEWIFFEN